MLAPRYIPHEIRSINEAPANVMVAPIPPQLQSSLHHDPETRFGQIRSATVPSMLSQGKSDDAEFLERIRPLRFIQQDCDLYDAVIERLQALKPKKEMKEKPVLVQPYFKLPSPAAPHRHSQLREPSVDDAECLASYCQIFEELLIEERRETLRLYERYSQYSAPVKISPVEADPNVGLRCWCTVELAGAADANPPIRPGDVMLARTQTEVPTNRNTAMIQLMGPATGRGTRATQEQSFGPPSIILDPYPSNRLAEVRCLVTRVQRHQAGGGGGGVGVDSVHASWLDRVSSHHLLLHNMPSVYNLRFVPSVLELFRCLTALDWLRLQPESSIRPLLFPTDAPILPLAQQDPTHPIMTTDGLFGDETKPLNVNQAEFVRVIMRRTAHPEHNLIRSPAILTGPAGTGKTGGCCPRCFYSHHTKHSKRIPNPIRSSQGKQIRCSMLSFSFWH